MMKSKKAAAADASSQATKCKSKGKNGKIISKVCAKVYIGVEEDDYGDDDTKRKLR